jgi:AraC-like DNA-binding protein
MYFSTRTVQRALRHEAWSRTLEYRCGSFVTDFGAEDFDGSIDARRVGGMDCVRIAQNSRGLHRSGRALDTVRPGMCLLILQLSGHCQLGQAGVLATLGPGDLSIIDLERPCHFEFERRNVQILMQIPRLRLEAGGAPWRDRLVTRLPSATASLVGTLLRSAFECVCRADGGHEQAVADAIVGLLAASGNVPAEMPSADEDLPGASLRSIQDYVIANLSCDGLSPSGIARAHGISERHLHRLFHGVGVSVCRWIRQSRLDRCAAQLRDREQNHRSIAQIAFAAGFNDAAHFSRLFRAEFGRSPTEYREDATPCRISALR